MTVRIVHNKLLNGWFIVTGAHQTPIGGRFDTREAAQLHLARGRAARDHAAVNDYAGEGVDTRYEDDCRDRCGL
jgi:hypothetical protein